MKNSGSLYAKSLAATTGLASHVAEIYFQGRTKLAGAWSVLAAAGVYTLWQNSSSANPKVSLPASVILSLQWWIRALCVIPARVLHCPAGPVSVWGPRSEPFENWKSLARSGNILVVETDAAGSGQWAYHITRTSSVISGAWPVDVSCQSINYKELWVVKKFLTDQRTIITQI